MRVNKLDKMQKNPKFAIEEIVKHRKIKLRDKSDTYSFFIKIVLFLFIMWIMFGVVFGIKLVNDMSMSPRISPRDILIYYRFNPQNQVSKVMVFEKNNQEFVGRIVARPGDTVEIKPEGGLTVNGSIVAETDIFYETKPYESSVKYPLRLDENEYFILSDHREGSKDSRYFGPVNVSEFKGEAIAIIRKSGL